MESRKSPGIGRRLATPLDSVQTLQTTLQTKAKREPVTRFYSLWDKVCMEEILLVAYRRCRANRGAPGCDEQSSSKLRNKVVINGWKDCGRSFGRSSINPSPCYVFGYPKQMAVNVH